MANTYSLIASSTVGAGGAANIDFTSIPQAYTDLCLKVSARGLASGYSMYLAINGSLANQTRRILYTDNGSSALSYNDSTAAPGWVNLATWTASTFSNQEIYIPNYTSGNNKTYSSDAVTENNATTVAMGMFAVLWSQTAAINQLTITTDSGNNLAQYTTAYLYGIKNS